MTAPLRASDPTLVNVALGERSYDIIIGRGQLASLGQRLVALRPGCKAAIVIVETDVRLHLAATDSGLDASGIFATPVSDPPGDGPKILALLGRLCVTLISARIQ